MAGKQTNRKGQAKTGRKKIKLSNLQVPKGGAVKGGTTPGTTKWGDITLKRGL